MVTDGVAVAEYSVSATRLYIKNSSYGIRTVLFTDAAVKLL